MRVYHRTPGGYISYRPGSVIVGGAVLGGVLIPTLVAGMWQVFVGLAVAAVVVLGFLRVSHRQHLEQRNCVWCRYDHNQAIQVEARRERHERNAAQRGAILAQGDGGWPLTLIVAFLPAMTFAAGLVGHQPAVYFPALALLAGWWAWRTHLRRLPAATPNQAAVSDRR